MGKQSVVSVHNSVHNSVPSNKYHTTDTYNNMSRSQNNDVWVQNAKQKTTWCMTFILILII